MEDPKLTVIALTERMVSLNDKAEAAHRRIDKMELLLRQDLNDLKNEFKDMTRELKDVVAWMNKGKGMSAAMFFLASIAGGLITVLANKIF